MAGAAACAAVSAAGAALPPPPPSALTSLATAFLAFAGSTAPTLDPDTATRAPASAASLSPAPSVHFLRATASARTADGALRASRRSHAHRRPGAASSSGSASAGGLVSDTQRRVAASRMAERTASTVTSPATPSCPASPPRAAHMRRARVESGSPRPMR